MEARSLSDRDSTPVTQPYSIPLPRIIGPDRGEVIHRILLVAGKMNQLPSPTLNVFQTCGSKPTPNIMPISKYWVWFEDGLITRES